jgi:hypothetical protein
MFREQDESMSDGVPLAGDAFGTALLAELDGGRSSIVIDATTGS